MARNRASMREGPLAELFRATEAAQKQGKGKPKDEAAQRQLADRAGREPERSRPRRRRSVASRRRPSLDPEEPRASGRSRAGSTRFPISLPASSARATARRTWPSSAWLASAAPD